jgi:hypothetical protein
MIPSIKQNIFHHAKSMNDVLSQSKPLQIRLCQKSGCNVTDFLHWQNKTSYLVHTVEFKGKSKSYLIIGNN